MASIRVRSAGVRALRARPGRFGLWASFVRPVRRGHVQRGRRRVDLRRLRARADSVRVGSERMRTVRGGEICLECHRMQQLPAIRRGAHEPPRRGGLRHLRGRLLLRRPELPRLSLVGDVRAQLDAREPVDRGRGLLSLLDGHAGNLPLQAQRRLRRRRRQRRRPVREPPPRAALSFVRPGLLHGARAADLPKVRPAAEHVPHGRLLLLRPHRIVRVCGIDLVMCVGLWLH
mmetsp:Transcript_7814/g.21912  ORF Transcript_7814/g.21912 Transcript_7814/m.21912 type:complete len:231 (-) Transcript_7814:4136-4828(-)